VATLMAGDATTLPLRDTPAAGSARRRGLLGRRPALLAGADTGVRVAAVALLAIVLLSAFVVIMAADRPSILSATTHTNFLPRWMAGPLGGLWPGLTRNGTTLKYMFTGALVVMYAAYLIALSYAPRLPARLVLASIAAVHVIFFLSPPLALTDIFNYVNYGRMEVVHHLNPYTTIPILEPHSDPSFVLSNWHQLLSPYGPLFTLLTFAVVPLGVVASFWVIKGLLAVASLATIFLVWKCARLLRRDPVTAIVLVGLNPIVLVWGLGGDHNDFLLLFFIVLGYYLLLLGREQTRQPSPQAAPGSGEASPGAASAVRRRGAGLLHLWGPELGAGAAFVTAAAIKASGAVLIPVVLAGLIKTPRRLLQVAIGMLIAAVLAATASLIAFGLHIPDLSTQSRLVTNVSVPNLIGLAIGSGGETPGLHTVLSAVLLVSVLLCCVQAWRRRDSITASGWASVALLVTLSWVLPWYVLWVLPLAALSSSRRLRSATLVLGVYFIIAWAPASGQLWNAIGFHPEKTSLGRLHQRYVKELLN
jgi:hypothetical protein